MTRHQGQCRDKRHLLPMLFFLFLFFFFNWNISKVKPVRASSRGWKMHGADVRAALELKGNSKGGLRPWRVMTSPLRGPRQRGLKIYPLITEVSKGLKTQYRGAWCRSTQTDKKGEQQEFRENSVGMILPCLVSMFNLSCCCCGCK